MRLRYPALQRRYSFHGNNDGFGFLSNRSGYLGLPVRRTIVTLVGRTVNTYPPESGYELLCQLSIFICVNSIKDGQFPILTPV